MIPPPDLPPVHPRRKRETSVSRGAYPYREKLSAAEERFWSGTLGNAQLRLSSGERSQFTTRLTKCLTGGKVLPLAHRTCAIAET